MRLRLRSTKLGKIRFVSHRDAARIWERSFRRVGLPLVFTQGFTPRPKISFGLALPTCAESIAEYVDIDLNAETDSAEMADILDIDTLHTRLSAVLPLGFDVLAVAELDRADPDQAGSLQETVTSSTWELWSARFTPASIAAAPRLLDADVLMVERERKGQRRTDDVRPLVLDLRPIPRAIASWSNLPRSAGRFARPSWQLRRSPMSIRSTSGYSEHINGSHTTVFGARCSRCRPTWLR